MPISEVFIEPYATFTIFIELSIFIIIYAFCEDKYFLFRLY